jgi:hypothetical protein
MQIKNNRKEKKKKIGFSFLNFSSSEGHSLFLWFRTGAITPKEGKRASEKGKFRKNIYSERKVGNLPSSVLSVGSPLTVNED